MSDDLMVLTPASRPRPRFPRLAPVLFVVGLAGALASHRGASASGVSNAVQALFLIPAVLGALLAAIWLEESFYAALAGRRLSLRLLAYLIAPLPIFLVGGLLAAGAGAISPLDGGTLGLSIAVGAWWLLWAGVGSLVVLVVDSVVNLAARSLRWRMTLAMLALVVLAAVPCVLIAVETPRMLAEAQQTGRIPLPLNLRVSGRQAVSGGTLASPEDAFPAVVFLLVLAISSVLPSVMSACSKLADAMMERVYPLSRAFELLGQGRLDVRVEEKGSADFVAVNRAFNSMVGSLSLARRMEHAFGRYLGKQVMERVRAQHGQADIPASSRPASVLFADIRGFTSMSERLEPAQVLALLNRYFERVVEIIDRHEGYLNKFIGDAVVVVFNAPIDQPDHAERAVRCAIEVQQEVARLNAQGAFPEAGELKVGIGIATGPVVAGNLGSEKQMEYTVIGDTVNLASRLTSKAPAGEVWVNQENAAALPAALARTALEPLLVKGKQKPVVPSRVWPAPQASESSGEAARA